VSQERGTVFAVPAGAEVIAARDRYGNRALTSSGP
jgi:hypothetical protein